MNRSQLKSLLHRVSDPLPKLKVVLVPRIRTAAREASDIAQLALPVVQEAAGLVPIAGAGLRAAIAGLLQVLQAIDARNQNMADLEQLKSRLERLNQCASRVPHPQDIREVQLREMLLKNLVAVTEQLKHVEQRKLIYKSVTNFLAGCSKDIQYYLTEYTAEARMHDHELIFDIHAAVVQNLNPMGWRPMTVTLVDASNQAHPIPMEYCTSFQQLRNMLGVILDGNFPGARVQKQYFEEGKYDLCINRGQDVVHVTGDGDGWPSIEPGTTLTMRVIISQEREYHHVYECPSCGALNEVNYHSHEGWLTKGFIQCQICPTAYQVFRPKDGKQNKNTPRIDNVTRSTIRNYRIDEVVSSEISNVSKTSWRWWLRFQRVTPLSTSPSDPHVCDHACITKHSQAQISEITNDSNDSNGSEDILSLSSDKTSTE